ncbi:zinc finger MYM-type protein 1 [Hydra vulgaris]|uniref:zinc finger MYM-type protein 1 n=1 Tax=Hydra vulgaris TaxID=6087 RepID=UPI001F5E66B5|nr:zinc finger MYM-type protein 1-like [Hydra vulgaris]
MNNQRPPRLNQLSGAAGRKRAMIRKKNESKNKRTLLDCVRWTKIEDKCKQFNDIEIGINDSNELPDHNSDKLFLADDIDDSQKTSSHLKKDQLDFVLDCHNDQQIYKSDLSIPISNDPAQWKSISDTDRTNIILMGPSSNPSNFPRDQKERKFPTYIFLEEQRNGEKVRRDWLVWSKAVASLFCFPCSLFGSPNLTRPGVQSSLLSWNGGIHGNWRKLSDRVKSHQQSDFHRNCYLQWKTATIHLKSQKSIEHQLEKQIGDEAKRWKVILQCILDVTIFLASRNLAFRGSNQKLFKNGNGNFLGALELIARHNKTLKDHMHLIAKHQDEEKRMQAHYLSWKSQNEFIKECGKLVVREVIREIKKSIYFTIITDNTPHSEQITFVFRFLHFNDNHLWEIKERFLKLEELEKKKGSDITKLILNVLEENELDIKNCRGQGYDNGANMAGIYNGVQALIRQNNPQAIFIPCSAHSLNLCAVHAIESLAPAKSYFGNI